MNLSPIAQATLLLTSYFSKANTEDVKPLSNAEWGRFALWLKDKSITPADLLVSDPRPLLNGWRDTRVSIERIESLLSRGHSLALAVEKWQRAGLWLVTRSDPDYPKRLKLRLKNDSPPVLFGCGNKSLLNSGGLAVIGSRNASVADLAFTEQLGVKAASEGIAIVSGGARGVDEAAMQGAMLRGGSVIGVMADSLLKAATSAKWRKGLLENNVVLVSPFYPEAGFNAGNAMARNKYIYCMASSSLVIHSGKKGGTLNGAEENLKKGWVPLWVKPTNDTNAANADLVEKGGAWIESDLSMLQIASMLQPNKQNSLVSTPTQRNLFTTPDLPGIFDELETEEKTENVTASDSMMGVKNDEVAQISEKEQSEDVNESIASHPVDFYNIFLGELYRLASSPITLEELLEQTGLHKSQLNDWLKRASEECVVKKLSKPVRYQVINNN
ncbi:DNA-protecting protein DprA [Vibrio vulnificus]|nr:DNA-processing protein DprA [Vibrio vulnificus]EIE1227262.1 DNA-protecting protein DprA [Vibrio vulnificus]ELA4931288.1 DNA-protecting protein DprA [Vibrio vulnificus]EME0829214.1 DNA-protecting protein DprA [Vibrio vulnificus]